MKKISIGCRWSPVRKATLLGRRFHNTRISMRIQSIANFYLAILAGGGKMKPLHIERVKKAISDNDRRKRYRAVDWLAKHDNINGLLDVMDNSRCDNTRLRAEVALSKYNFK